MYSSLIMLKCLCGERVNSTAIQCIHEQSLIIPPANFVCGGYTVFTLSVRACVCVCMRSSATFCFLNI